MTVSIPITLTTIETAWGTQVATDVNGLLARTTALEAINAGTRLGTAESEIDTLQSITAPIGTRNSHTYNPGEVIASGGACKFNNELYRSGISTVEDFSYWDIVTSGVYAISWRTEITVNNGRTTLNIASSERARYAIDSNGVSAGAWSGYISAGARIQVFASFTGGTTPYIGGNIDIFRVAQGG